MYCGDFSTNSAYERMKSTSETKGYKTTYSRQGNSNSSNNSGVKVATGIVAVGIISFMVWKNVIKPAAEVISKFANLFNEDENKKDNVMREDDRILSGTCRPLSRSEKRAIERKYSPIERDVKYVIYDD